MAIDLDSIRDRKIDYLLEFLPDGLWERAEDTLTSICYKHGPFVESYPTWHPLVMNQVDPRCPWTEPGERVGYRGLDHTVLLRNAFITCPYSDAEAKEVIESVEKLPQVLGPFWSLNAERIDCRLYHESAWPVLVYCEWGRGCWIDGGKITLRQAAGLLLESEMKLWREAEVGESWETMESYFLGRPNDGESSAFLTKTAIASLKTMWNAVVGADVFGPVKR